MLKLYLVSHSTPEGQLSSYFGKKMDMRMCDEDLGSQANWPNSLLSFSWFTGSPSSEGSDFLFLDNYISPSHKERWCWAWVWWCLSSAVLCRHLPRRPWAVCQKLACWLLAGSQRFLGAQLCSSSDYGERGFSISVFPWGQAPSPQERQQCWIRQHWLARG